MIIGEATVLTFYTGAPRIGFLDPGYDRVKLKMFFLIQEYILSDINRRADSPLKFPQEYHLVDLLLTYKMFLQKFAFLCAWLQFI